jgi:glutamate 5-kinase
MSRIVIKLGTGILSTEGGLELDKPQFHRLAEEVAELMARGDELVLVSSGAVAAGVACLGLPARPGDLASKQACAAIGQPALVEAYAAALRPHGLLAAQLLLTHFDIDSRLHRTNARNTLDRLLAVKNVLPIINENDSVAVDELRFGDNDRLSAEVAVLIQADLLVILTSVDGLYDGEQLVPRVDDLERALGMVRADVGTYSVGGMRTKIEAAKIARDGGLDTVIANGRTPGLLRDLARGQPAGTLIPTEKSRRIPMRS